MPQQQNEHVLPIQLHQVISRPHIIVRSVFGAGFLLCCRRFPLAVFGDVGQTHWPGRWLHSSHSLHRHRQGSNGDPHLLSSEVRRQSSKCGHPGEFLSGGRSWGPWPSTLACPLASVALLHHVLGQGALVLGIVALTHCFCAARIRHPSKETGLLEHAPRFEGSPHRFTSLLFWRSRCLVEQFGVCVIAKGDPGNLQLAVNCLGSHLSLVLDRLCNRKSEIRRDSLKGRAISRCRTTECQGYTTACPHTTKPGSGHMGVSWHIHSGAMALLSCVGRYRASDRLLVKAPNPSIEGTCNIRLRLLSPSPHVKR